MVLSVFKSSTHDSHSLLLIMDCCGYMEWDLYAIPYDNLRRFLPSIGEANAAAITAFIAIAPGSGTAEAGNS